MTLAVVVGANGFLGSSIVKKLIDENVEVLAVYNKRFDSIDKKAKLITSEDLLNSNTKPDYVFFVVGNYTNSHQELLLINENLYRYSLKFNNSKFIYISSTNIYGIHDSIITETSSFNNPGIYAQSKLSGEFIVSSMLNYALVRLTYIYGRGITNNSFIPQIIKSAKDLNQITLFGDGGRKQDYIYIDDAVELCLLSAKTKFNGIYLGATGKSISNREVAEEVAKFISCTVVFKGKDLGASFYFNTQKTQLEVNWTPKILITEGIKNMLL
ncbi:NAD(P)-dependent oxidoreductase [Flavobacterium sp. RSP49]|uniref:NAD-dependent epimerase/dehydratase family protein n=1 Tax=Flavobacterium sp. RSP49 TaxID=2497487 RepID=UPI000F82FD59|nr:NAD(P)-dependent oxidoreductase [Flavobacterium sp. RSP49]RTZ00882.1 NAD(P)-dependent oxidoreductase [Flavobacterium sp. RSP49]